MLKKFKDLTEREILAIAIANEEEDGRIYGEFADALRESYPATAEMFEEMRVEEAGHRDRLLSLFRNRFGEQIPPIRREDVRGFLKRRPVWMMRPLGVKVARRQAEIMEMEASRFYTQAAGRTSDVAIRELLNTLADEERKHTQAAGAYEEKHLTEQAKDLEAPFPRSLVHAAIRPTWPRGIDGRLRFHTRSHLRRRFCHAQKLGRLSGRHGRQHWRGHFHGLRRIALR